MVSASTASGGAARIGTARARAALLGNPSDAYGGAVIAMTLDALVAEVEIAAVHGEPPPLVQATASVLHRHGIDAPARPRALVRTTIPREVGLGGSSAIAVATIRALAPKCDPATIARLAMMAETDELAITAGPQDRIVQANEGLLFMDFAAEYSAPHVQRLDPGLLPPMFVAWRAAAPESSGSVHRDLRARVSSGERRAIALLSELGAIARAGRDRLLAGDRDSLGPLLDRAHDLRAALMPLRDEHVTMIETCRAHGISAQYAGSGGAIVGLRPAHDRWPALREALEALTCETIEV